VVHTDTIIATRAQQMASHTVVHTRISFAHDQRRVEQNTLRAFLTFCTLGCIYCAFTFFTTQKQYWWDV